jgi:hypothetical protein
MCAGFVSWPIASIDVVPEAGREMVTRPDRMSVATSASVLSPSSPTKWTCEIAGRVGGPGRLIDRL